MSRTPVILSLMALLVLTTACSQGPAEDAATAADNTATDNTAADGAATDDTATDNTATDNTATDDTATADAEGPGAELNVDEQGRAARGFDVVAYHATNEAVAGDATFAHTWQGAEWLFANAENRDAFAADPERYAPSNGGYCTFGVILKKKLDVDPEVFLVEDDSLYLFLNPEVQEKFLGDKEGNLQIVEQQWPEIAPVDPAELAGEG